MLVMVPVLFLAFLLNVFKKFLSELSIQFHKILQSLKNHLQYVLYMFANRSRFLPRAL